MRNQCVSWGCRMWLAVFAVLLGGAADAGAQLRSIFGRVTSPQGSGLAGIRVSALVWDDMLGDWRTVTQALTGATGNYTLRVLDGVYRIQFADTNATPVWAHEFYDDIPIVDWADDVEVAGANVTGINAVLARAGRIRGEVRDGAGRPIEGILVSAWLGDYGWAERAEGVTGADGRYVVNDLYPGVYRVLFEDPAGRFAPEVHLDAASLDEGDDVEVGAGAEVTGINAVLATAGAVAGTVRDAQTAAPLAGILAEAYAMREGIWTAVGQATTTVAGTYVIGGLRAEPHRVQFSDPRNEYLPQVFNGAATLEEGDDIEVAAGATNANVNAELRRGAMIEGTVRDAATGQPLADIAVELWIEGESGWSQAAFAFTDPDGRYRFAPLWPGTYVVQFWDMDGNYADQYFDGATVFGDATRIHLSWGEQRTNVNAAMTSAARISGRVTSSLGAPLADILVQALVEADGDWWLSRATTTDPDGRYEVRGLAAGVYRVLFWDENGEYGFQVWNGVSFVEDGSNIVLAAGQAVSGIDAVLPLGARLGGRITDLDGQTPLPGIGVQLYGYAPAGWRSNYLPFVVTEADGSFLLAGLPPGTFRLEFLDETAEYLPEFFAASVTFEGASNLVVAAGEALTNLTMRLTRASRIRGTVLRPGGRGRGGIEVVAYQRESNGAPWRAVSSAVSGEDGSYELGGLRAGTYRLLFHDPSGVYADVVFDGAPDLDSGTDVVVGMTQTVANVAAVVQPVTPAQPAEVEEVHRLEGESVLLRVTGTPGREYVVEVAETPRGPWLPEGEPLQAGDEPASVEVSLRGPATFIRVRWDP